MVKDLQRTAIWMELEGGAPSVPSAFPTNTIFAQRLLVSISNKRPQVLIPLTRKLWKAYWQQDIDIGQVENILPLCTQVGLSQDDIKLLFEGTHSCSSPPLPFKRRR
jgi:2-hydroxychromene-2-carboxylate isomerase